MELLYTWINQDSRKYIVEQGFNFNPFYQFSVSVDNNGSHPVYKLSCKETKAANFKFADTCIQNITAIVGKNGAGKTSLLLALQRNELLPLKGNPIGSFQKAQNEEKKRLAAYRTDTGKILILHNYNQDEWKNETSYEMRNVSNKGGKNSYTFEEAESILKQQSIVYLSNSSFIDKEQTTGIHEHKYLEYLSLHPKSIRLVSSRFFQRIVMAPKSAYQPTMFVYLNALLIKNKDEQDFQKIWDIVYYRIADQAGRLCERIQAFYPRILVNFSDAIRTIERTQEYEPYLKSSPKDSASSLIRKLVNSITKYNEWLSNSQWIIESSKTNPVITLLLNLIFEMYVSKQIQSLAPIETAKGSDSQAAYDILLKIIEEYVPHSKKEPTSAESYFDNAYKEITELHEIIHALPFKSNLLPKNDSAFSGSTVIEASNKEAFKEYCALIERCARNESSFILKYLSSSVPGLSSGERAYLNFFSWLELPPNYSTYIGKSDVPLANNVLLLIDEIDLYMHPEWQRIAVKRLIDTLVEQTDKSKRFVQIIFTTHSPLVLSDIPKQNTIYIQQKQNKLFQLSPEGQPQTFGMNLTTLLNNAFFLQSMMGEFAYERISSIADKLLKIKKSRKSGQYSSQEEDKNILSTIRLIGEPLLHDRLLSLYEECFPDKHKELVDEYLEGIISAAQKLAKHRDDPMEVARLKKLLTIVLRLLNDTDDSME